MEIYLIRHTTPLTEKGQIYGRTDVALGESFQEEAAKILAQLPVHMDAVFSSPSLRCTRLAAAITDHYSEVSGAETRAVDELPFQTDEALYELNFGDWEGKTWDTIDRAASETWMSDFVHLSPPGGETMLEMQHRVSNFWDRLLQQPYKNVCVVTHGGVIRILLARYKSVLLKDSFSIKVGMAEVFKLSVSG
ncbi:alpha-ribazole phosphatase [Pedobacter westerhofensis]|uniref:Alpha-ribazole phosphatase n=1 Tax=Pedobacter westerhofensis TaxID=425512 RepID=A0A521FQ54_9SPHI|nr:alpha-ribazole phosphatase [Pedobacter westerhofensis]SMO97660.1 alpha-ribazole phosphatase [Pedobacter westerhofensis]